MEGRYRCRRLRGNTAFLWQGKPPERIAWDCRREDGSLAPIGGRYKAILDVDFGGLYQPGRSTTRIFTLQNATRGRPGSTCPAVSLQAASTTPADRIFASFEGKWPEDRVSWNGRSSSGEIVESCNAVQAQPGDAAAFGEKARAVPGLQDKDRRARCIHSMERSGQGRGRGTRAAPLSLRCQGASHPFCVRRAGHKPRTHGGDRPRIKGSSRPG